MNDLAPIISLLMSWLKHIIPHSLGLQRRLCCEESLLLQLQTLLDVRAKASLSMELATAPNITLSGQLKNIAI